MHFLTTPSLHAEATGIVISRCSMCHAASPVWEGIVAPPKGVRLESEADIRREARAIALQSVLSHAMPPNNITELSETERAKLALFAADVLRTTR